MRRTLLAITAVLLATIGTTLLYVYVSTADNRAKAQIVQVSVLVAAQVNVPGTPATQVIATRKQVAGFDKVDGALTSLDGVQGQVLTTRVAKGQQLTADMFGKATVGGLPSGDQAVCMTFGDAARVASLTKAGSLVDIVKLTGGTSKIVLHNAKVLSVQGQIVTFDMSPQQAPTLLDLIAAGGQLILAYNGQSS
jgi:pilus assembly protein CpaB